jgi:peptidoglycan/LPS O-acetylase OafA/YrhL
MGEISYSIYLLHMIPLYASIYASSVWGFTSANANAAVIFATVTLTYVGALAAYHLIERPGIDIGAWLTRSRLTADKAPNSSLNMRY